MIIDPAVIRAVVGDDRVAIRELVEDFLPAAHADVAAITQAANRLEAVGVSFASHRLKGSAALLGARYLKEVCAQLESAGRMGNWEIIRDLLANLDRRMQEVDLAVGAFLRQIEKE
jgi:HPt (histidine-containing phosphotransfer) domain-containing protein